MLWAHKEAHLVAMANPYSEVSNLHNLHKATLSPSLASLQ